MVVFSAWRGHLHSLALTLPCPSAEMSAWGCGQPVAHSWPNLLVNSPMQHLAHLPLAVSSWHMASARDLSWELPAVAGDALSALAPSHLYVTGITSQMPLLTHPPHQPPYGSHQHPLHATGLAHPRSPFALSITGEGWGLLSCPTEGSSDAGAMSPDAGAMSLCLQVQAQWPGSVHEPPKAVASGVHGPGGR